jgi:hypothetical protein
MLRQKEQKNSAVFMEVRKITGGHCSSRGKTAAEAKEKAATDRCERIQVELRGRHGQDLGKGS